jgi:hypothetical protein
MEVLSWYVLLDSSFLAFNLLVFFRLQDTGSKRDGMQPHDGTISFVLFSFELFINMSFFYPSVRVTWM